MAMAPTSGPSAPPQTLGTALGTQALATRAAAPGAMAGPRPLPGMRHLGTTLGQTLQIPHGQTAGRMPRPTPLGPTAPTVGRIARPPGPTAGLIPGLPPPGTGSDG